MSTPSPTATTTATSDACGVRSSRLAHATIAVGVALAALAPATIAGAGDVTSPSKHHRGETCRGVPATHVNEDGTAGDDVIVVTEPKFVAGWNGDDLICVKLPVSHYGAEIDGGRGDDTIITYSGENFIYGGEDDDSILSNSSDHVLDGEDGNDTIYMGRHPDGAAYGGDGNDRIFGTSSGDYVHAGAGNDLVIGFAGNDNLDGGTGNDRLEGRNGTDDLDGQSGDDTCVDAAAPATTLTSCESIVGLGVGGGPGGFELG